jgi:beta-lactamase regulating signal transducer with metallopeptidase domain
LETPVPDLTAFLAAFAPSLAWALLDFVWQGMLVAWIAALALGLLRGARPQARYLVACLSLLACIALPVTGVVQRMAAPAPTASFAVIQLQAAVGGGGVSPVQAGSSPSTLAGVPHVVRDWESRLSERLPLVVALWSIGAGLLALRMALGLAWVKRRRAEAFAHGDVHWQQVLDRLARKMGIARRVRLGLLGEIDSPVTAGWWRPVVLVPGALLTGMPPHYLEALLAHELAHVRRHDYLVNLFQGAVEILLFYHPAVWWLSNRIRIEREQVADDLAASTLGEPRRLALALSELDRFQLSTPQLAPAAHGGDLMSRIKRLVRPTSEPLQWKMALPVLGLVAACAAFYANAAAPTQALKAAAGAAAQAAGTAAMAIGASNQAAQAAAGAATAESRAAKAAAKAARAAQRDQEPSYALVRVRNGNTSISGSTSSRDWEGIKVLKEKNGSDFIWFREGGKAYVIKDAGVLAEAEKAWAPVEAAGKEMEVHGAEMEKHGKVMEALGKKMEAAGREMRMDKGAERKLAEIARKQAALGAEMARVGMRMGGKEAAAAEREMAKLEKQMEALEKQMEAESARVEKLAEAMAARSKPMEDIGRQMEEAGKPMDALGKQMEVLGERMDGEVKVAESKMRALIASARSKGLVSEAN